MWFSKAFDRVPHHRLCYKLFCYGIQGNTLSWIKIFLLSGRLQQVIINGHSSSYTKVISGVPQGSRNMYSVGAIVISLLY